MDTAAWTVFFDLHSGLVREGPGDRATVEAGLALVGALPDRPQILDLACGPGGQTVDLAELIPDAQIIALDSHRPFLRDVETRAAIHGVADRITTVNGDMAQLPYEPGRFDLIWCEGAAYMLGLERAFTAWKPLLKPGGALALSEPVWLQDDPPPEALANWAGYAAMGRPDDVRAAARSSGFEVVGDFVLSEAAWWNYYGPLEARLEAILPGYAGDAVAKPVLDAGRSEIECYRRHSASFGYLFIVLRA